MDMARQTPDSQALIADDDVLSYAALAGRMGIYAAWALRQGIKRGEAVALLAPNGINYAAVWLGIGSVRGVVALINSQVSGEALVHALQVVQARHIIADAQLMDKVVAVLAALPTETGLWRLAADGGLEEVRAGKSLSSGGEVLLQDETGPGLSDLALYIYTSGTTGLPKAARLTHRRIAEWSCWFAGMLNLGPADRLYNCLPMYHSVGGVVAVGSMLVSGGSVVIRPKFTAHQFWEEVVRFDCTVFQYIGELCRYLLNIAPHAQETGHRLRLACGNGLRPDIWEAFRSRFQIPRIVEFYASTEGNLALYNYTDRAGAIGHVPKFLAHRFPVAIVRCDAETLTLLRDEKGLCVQCGAGEAGEALGRISNSGRSFDGYVEQAASTAKIASDVFVEGDTWYRTGDLMQRDREGYYYFVDRLGENFRWKGENVAASEVAAALRGLEGILDAVVYGVEVPGMEGRAGMAAVVTDSRFNPKTAYSDLRRALPDYACPVFLRLCDEIAVTGTFKPLRTQLAREGYDLSCVDDPIFALDRGKNGYVAFDDTRWQEILSAQGGRI
jgi:fatty-acyl-CoA synthase